MREFNLQFNEYNLYLRFLFIPLAFQEDQYSNIFKDKNNKTLSQTIKHRRYGKFSDEVKSSYSNFLNYPLGKFLFHLKNLEDEFYKNFLNKYGDLTYSIFKISNSEHMERKGVYLYKLNDEIVYVGRCKDNLKKRLNRGYGKISPKNCYLDGQATNCRLNALITENKDAVSFWFCEITNDTLIEKTEINVIRSLQPIWNIQR